MPEQFVVPDGQAQLLFVHTRLAKQTCAQNPQFSLSFCRSTHELPHLARPEPQLIAHAPLLHTCPPMQRFPHAPQFCALDCKSVQTWPIIPAGHASVPAAHAQLPLVHVAPNAHWFPQLPQLPLLVWRLTQVLPMRPEHDVSPVVQPVWHAPATHMFPPPQRTPHDPQLFGSLCVLVHCPLHIASPPPQMHIPVVQLAPGPHAFPQVPQSNGSVARSTHALLQLVCPALHDVVHTPAAQTFPAAHVVPQPPQFRGSLCVSVHTPLQRIPLL